MNHKTLQRLERVMTRHGLKKVEVADLLGVSRVLVTRWFQHQRRCDDRHPETLKAIMDIRDRASVDGDLLMKRRERLKLRRKQPSYPCK
jgi:predicted transcriptional regulator